MSEQVKIVDLNDLGHYYMYDRHLNPRQLRVMTHYDFLMTHSKGRALIMNCQSNAVKLTHAYLRATLQKMVLPHVGIL